MSDDDRELSEFELAAFDTEARARYRAMTGMDQPLAVRAERARRQSVFVASLLSCGAAPP